MRFKLPSQSGVRVKISLLPYLNVAMNAVGSTYGPWPLCGEITILELNTSEGIWRGYLTYADGIYYPKRDEIRGLNLNQWQTVGLEWTEECISWICNGSVSDGTLKGDVVQSVDSSNWYTLQRPSCDVPKSEVGRKLPAPAPFDQPFHLVVELTQDIDSPTSGTPLVGQLLLDWVKLYSRPTSDELSTAEINQRLFNP